MAVCYWCGAKDTLADIGKELDDGKYKMVQCSKCKNAYYVVNREKMNKPKPMTNEEHLRSCTTEQLAEFLTKIILDDKRFRMTMVGGVNETKMWLKQPHRNE